MQSLADFSLEAFRSYKNHTAFIEQTGFRNKKTTYGEIEAGALKIATAFRQLGIQPGDRIIIWGENSARWAMTFYACMLSRIVAVPLDASFTAAFVNKIAAITEARLICSDHDGAAWNKLLETQNSFIPDSSAPSPETLLEIIYTSGTTGDPKGVMITHGNVLANLLPIHREIQKYLKYTKFFSQFGFVHLIPLSHLFGQVTGLFIPQMLGGKIIFADPAPPQVLRAVKTNRAAAVICVPHELSLLRKMIERKQIVKIAEIETKRALKRWWKYRKIHRMFGLKFWAFIVGGATLPIDEEEFWRKLGFAVIQGYGLTETAPSVTITHPFKGIVQGSVGKVLPGLEVRIADDGEVMVRGPNISPGYFRNEEATREMFENGWLRTGDLGRFDENRNLVLFGRKKEVIVLAGGMNVYPEDVEAALNQQTNVRESAVVNSGSDDKPRVHAVLVLKEGSIADEVVAKANKILQPHQQIQSWSLWPHDELPRTSTGKLKRLAIQKGSAGDVSSEPQIEQIAAKILEGRVDSSRTDLGLSSLEQLELMMELEQKAGIELNETEFAKAKTMSDVVRLIDRPSSKQSEDYSPFAWRLWWPLRIFRKVIWYSLAAPAMWIRMTVHASGLENLRNIEGPILFVCNHQSILDPPVILKALPRSWRRKLSPAMGTTRRKLDLMASSLFFNSYPLPVSQVGLRSAIQHTGWLADHGYYPLIFPEGKRTQDGALLPFRPGIGVIVKETGLRVIPIVLKGAFEVWPETARGPAKGDIHVHFGPVFDFAGKQPEEITKELEEWYKKNY
jgi:long-chain acyl-CoA synthetase